MISVHFVGSVGRVAGLCWILSRISLRLAQMAGTAVSVGAIFIRGQLCCRVPDYMYCLEVPALTISARCMKKSNFAARSAAA